MSTQVMAACWPLCLPPTAKSVLISLADNANDHGHCWPSIPKIAERTCLTERSVRRAIAELESRGVLSVDRSNGRHNSYFIVTNQGLSVTPDTESPLTQSPKPRTLSPKPRTQSPPNRKNHQEPSRKEIVPALDLSTWPQQPSPQVLSDWLDHRKRKRAPVSATVIAAFGRELHKAAARGFDVDACLSTAMQRNWQGLNADWLGESNRPRINGTNPQPVGKTMQAIMNLEAMKSGNRLAGGRVVDGDTEIALLGIGEAAGNGGFTGNGSGVD